MEKSKKVSDRILYQYYRTVHKTVSNMFLQNHESQFHEDSSERKFMRMISLGLGSTQHHLIGSFDLI